MNEEEETSPTALWMTDAEGGGRPLLAPPRTLPRCRRKAASAF